MIDGRLLRRTGAVWLVLAAGAAALRAMDAVVAGRAVTAAGLAGDLPLIALWAAATPFILASARRAPVRGGRASVNALVHFLTGSAFIVATNVAIRLPLLASGAGTLAASTLHGLSVYYPGAIAMYAVIVAVGHWLDAPAAVPAAPSAVTEPAPGDARLVIREWNRVHLVMLDDIDWIEANNNHVVVHTPARVYKGRERISDVESRLDPRRFVRVHRSAIVHLPKIREVQPLMRGDQAIVLRSGQVVRVARSRRQALEEALGTPL